MANTGMGINQDTFDDYHSSLQSLALASVRNAVAFPQDISFHRSMSSGFARDLEEVEKRVLRLTNKLLDLSASLDTSREGSRKEKEKARLQDEDDVTDSFHSAVVDVVDQLLERTDTCLDRYLGRIKPPAVTVNPPTAAPRKAQNRSQLQPVIQHASHISKPQLAFFRPVDNSDAPWRPSLKHKYHAKVPLGHAYRGDHPMEGEVSQPSPNHPYHYELVHLEYPSHVFQAPTDSKPPKGLEDTTFHWVSTPLETRAMLEKLRHCQEIAVDLEWHGYRTYRGFLCLMQLSTRDGDWVVDVLSLRQVQGGIEELESLGEVFANPNIVKVLHGADSDIVWLQQDFNLYIVNMFDTYHASKLLAFPRHGLANLLEMYCDFIPDKRYQLADWRIRPLPSDMLQYARSDTHFLLYIYDQLRLALVDRSSSRPESPSLIHQNTEQGDSSRRFVREILSRSTETCLKVYCKEAYDEEAGTGRDGWDTLGRKWNKPQFCHSFANLENASSVIRMQRAVYQALHKWRDQVAREEDESTRYVLPNHHLFQLAERPPNDMATLLTLFTSFPPVIKRRAKELLTVIRRTVQQYSTATGQSDTPLVSTAERTGELLESATVGSQLRPSPPPNTSHRDLWSLASPSAKRPVVSSSSALFGLTFPQSPLSMPIKKMVSASSTLLGNTRPGRDQNYSLTAKIARSDASTFEQADKFKDLVTRIHSTLVIIPSLSDVTKVSQNTSTNSTSPDSGTTNAVGVNITESVIGVQHSPADHQKEVTYTAIPEAQDHSDGPNEDTLVVVGQARQKKRKRTKSAPQAANAGDTGPNINPPSEVEGAAGVRDSALAEGSKKKRKKADAKQDAPNATVFDFSTAPNILDVDPALHAEEPQRSKAKKIRSRDAHGGDFPAPPKPRNEVRSGNQSFTFK